MIGTLLTGIVGIARDLHVDPEAALRDANGDFEREALNQFREEAGDLLREQAGEDGATRS
jgi:hypothetical protein